MSTVLETKCEKDNLCKAAENALHLSSSQKRNSKTSCRSASHCLTVLLAHGKCPSAMHSLKKVQHCITVGPAKFQKRANDGFVSKLTAWRKLVFCRRSITHHGQLLALSCQRRIKPLGLSLTSESSTRGLKGPLFLCQKFKTCCSSLKDSSMQVHLT